MKKYALALVAIMAFGFPGEAMASGCSTVKQGQTFISVNLLTPEPVIDVSQKRKTLNAKHETIKEKWLVQNGMKPLWQKNDLTIAGVASGGWGAVYDFSIKSRAYDRTGAFMCVFFEDINIELMYRTVIYIPKEFKRNECRYNLVLAHEMLHHNANKKTVEKFVQKIREDLPMIVADLENQYIPSNQFEPRSQTIKTAVSDAIDVYFTDFMRKEMEVLNSAIDSPEEYARASIEMQKCGK